MHLDGLPQRPNLYPRGRIFVTTIEHLRDGGRLVVATFSGPERANTIRVGDPLPWATTLARHGSDAIVTKRNATCTQRVVVCVCLHHLASRPM